MSTPRERAIEMVNAERDRQNVKWGRGERWPDHVSIKLAVLMEETGEVGTAVINRDYNNLRDELVQVAAVAVAWIEHMEAIEDRLGAFE